MSAVEQDSAEAQDVAGALLGEPVMVRPVLGGGRNSRIWRADAAGRPFALKQYPQRSNDPRDRLSTEVGALRLMEAHGIDVVPHVVAVDRDRGFVLLSWIEGAPVLDVGDIDIDAAGAFLAAVHALRTAPDAARQPLASEACLSGAEIERQIRARLRHLSALPPGETDCHAFLTRDFAPALARMLALARARMQAAGLDFEAELPQERHSLIPADFGFHNSLRRQDGSLAFVDFEYFGWDDPVKLTADVLLHPGLSLALPQYRRFRSVAERLYGGDLTFGPRLDALLPLFGLRWVLILLNEFLPDRWQRRVMAGAAEDWGQAKTRQLGKARALLARISASKE
jgi:hypothetical protein